ncbi:colicin V synthesis protein [Limnobaculum parvum]|uniref:Colicin V synthesis protein n=1 Tax=Limnobaculum parvum TaxID=2172103 RepID=A0A2Y9U241_9GAMM|nr:colicin V synthesis protein [Limnobaculum parvum]AWH89870.1 colicin V synthesis protein [Limnobaculum parvum]
MRELNCSEMVIVNGGWAANLSDSMEGALSGFGQGSMIGFLGGAKVGGEAGGGILGVGVIGSLAGAFMGGAIGSLAFLGGMILGKDEINQLAKEYIDAYTSYK